MKFLRDSVQQQAELDYDRRQNLRDEKIKTYLDTQVMKYLIHHNNQSINNSAGASLSVDKDTIELTR